MTPSEEVRLLARFNGNPPASSEVLRLFETEFHFHLPEDYAHFLRRANGGEGFIGPNAYVILWRVESLAEMNKVYQVEEFARGLFLFGSDGGGDAFAFDARYDAKPVVSVPFIGMELKSARSYAPNFSAFLRKLFQT